MANKETKGTGTVGGLLVGLVRWYLDHSHDNCPTMGEMAKAMEKHKPIEISVFDEKGPFVDT